MLVGVTGFGSVWRRRVQGDASDPKRFARTAYFNTTGVMVNGKIVRHRKLAGHARFNGAGGFNANHPSRMVGKVFECDEPCVWNGQNKVFFRHVVPRPARPDCFLVVVGSQDALTGVEGARGVAESVPGARLEVIDGAGHGPHLETPMAFARIVTTFLTS